MAGLAVGLLVGYIIGVAWTLWLRRDKFCRYCGKPLAECGCILFEPEDRDE